MKKIIFTFITIFLGILSVMASTNKLYFASTGNRLYYDSDLFNKNLFLYHVDMLPGKTYQDELLIENKTNTEYILYLKIKENNDSDLARELLDNIIMTIYLDNKIIYEGYASGVDYVINDRNVNDSIYIGNYKKGEEQKLTVETTLKKEYSNTENTALSSIEWEFFAYYDKDMDVINPDTGDKITRYVNIVFIVVLVSVLVIFRYRGKILKK